MLDHLYQWREQWNSSSPMVGSTWSLGVDNQSEMHAHAWPMLHTYMCACAHGHTHRHLLSLHNSPWSAHPSVGSLALDRFDYSKIKNFFPWRTPQIVNRQTTDGEKIFAVRSESLFNIFASGGSFSCSSPFCWRGHLSFTELFLHICQKSVLAKVSSTVLRSSDESKPPGLLLTLPRNCSDPHHQV